MIYVITVILLLASALGIASAFALATTGIGVAFWCVTALAGAVFWALLTLHAVDAWVETKDKSLGMRGRLLSAANPYLMAGVIGTALTLALGWCVCRVIGLSVTQVTLSGLPLFMLAIAQAVKPKVSKTTRVPAKAMPWILSVVFLALSLLGLQLIAFLEGAQSLPAQTWVVATLLVTGLSCYISASYYQWSVTTGDVRRSPTIMRLVQQTGAMSIEERRSNKSVKRAAGTAPHLRHRRPSRGRGRR